MTDPDCDERDDGLLERFHYWLVDDEVEALPAEEPPTSDDAGIEPAVTDGAGDATGDGTGEGIDADGGTDPPGTDGPDPVTAADYGSMAYVDLDAGVDDADGDRAPPSDDAGSGPREVEAEGEPEPDPEPTAAGVDGGSRARTGSDSRTRARARDVGDRNESGVAGALADELAAGAVDDRTLSALQAALRGSGSTAADVRLDRLAIRVSEFDAYIDALEGLLDGVGDDEDIAGTLRRLDDRLGRLERESEADRVHLVEEVTTLREEVSLVSDRLDSLQRWQRRLARVLVDGGGGTGDVETSGPLRDGESRAGTGRQDARHADSRRVDRGDG